MIVVVVPTSTACPNGALVLPCRNSLAAAPENTAVSVRAPNAVD